MSTDSDTARYQAMTRAAHGGFGKLTAHPFDDEALVDDEGETRLFDSIDQARKAIADYRRERREAGTDDLFDEFMRGLWAVVHSDGPITERGDTFVGLIDPFDGYAVGIGAERTYALIDEAGKWPWPVILPTYPTTADAQAAIDASGADDLRIVKRKGVVWVDRVRRCASCTIEIAMPVTEPPPVGDVLCSACARRPEPIHGDDYGLPPDEYQDGRGIPGDRW